MSAKDDSGAAHKAGMRAAVKAALARLRDARTCEYDGVRGSLPAWVPEPCVVDFENLQTQVIGFRYDDGEHLSLDAAVAWIDADIRSIANPGFHGVPPMPPAVRDALARLAFLKYHVGQGPEKGLTALAGEDARRGKATRDGGLKGSERKHGPAADRQKARDSMQVEMNRLQADGESRMQAATKVGKQFDLSEKTVRTWTVNNYPVGAKGGRRKG